MATSKKPNDKLSKIDKRSASVAPSKKYSDMTPAEKRKWNANQSRYDAELTKQRKTATKSSPETIKAADKKGSGKPKYKGVDTKQHNKIMKGDTIIGKPTGKTKKAFQEGTREMVKEEKMFKKTNTAKPTTPKVPVKPRGGAGMRGGRGGMGFGGGAGLRGNVNK
jgi:uncharacterized protein YeaO (DUF488 family)